MKRIKKIIIFTIILVIPLILTGCINSEQLNERMLIQAVGVDRIDGVIEITLQVYAPATQGGSGISATADNAKIVKASGATVTDALQTATLTQGKTVFMGHNRILVLGRDLAENEILSTLDYFSSNSSSRHNISVVIADDKASDILTAKINQGIVPAETLEKMLTRATEIGMLKNVKLYELLSTLQNDYESAVLPIIKITKEDEQKEEEQIQPVSSESSGEESSSQDSQSKSNELETISDIKVTGMGIIKDGRLQNQIDTKQSRGLLFILNEVNNTTFTVDSDVFGLTAVQIYNSKSKITPTFEKDKITFNLEINSQALLGQKEKNTKLDENLLKQLEQETVIMIENECKQAFEIGVIQSNADIFEFGNLLWIKNHNLWETKRDNWENSVNEIAFTVDANVVINRVGLEL